MAPEFNDFTVCLKNQGATWSILTTDTLMTQKTLLEDTAAFIWIQETKAKAAVSVDGYYVNLSFKMTTKHLFFAYKSLFS